MLNVITLSVVMLSAIMLSAVMLNVVASKLWPRRLNVWERPNGKDS
jgi:hypothetical protein